MFFIEGMLGVLTISAFLWRTAFWKRLLAALVLLSILAAAATLGEVWNVTARGEVEWWRNTTWRNVILFLLLVLGMFARVAWDANERENAVRRRTRLRLSVRDFVRPALVALIVFQGVLLLARTQDLSWELALASFQNGFFWNTLFGRTRADIEGSAALAPR
jgi:hypothetical protein